MTAKLVRHRFTVSDYYRMSQAGILSEDDRVELIEGEIVEMTPIGSRHAGQVDRLNSLFSQLLGTQVIIRIQSPIRLSEYSEPQPDLALLRPRLDFYTHSHPEPSDVLLVVEVAETSVEYDKEVKLPLYAKFRIPEVWLLDLSSGGVEVYREPGPEGYIYKKRFSKGQSLSPNAFPTVVLTVEDILA